jgi:hypothetical protein
MHVSFEIHDRNILIDKKHFYLIPRPPSWDDRICNYGHQLYHSEQMDMCTTHNNITSFCTGDIQLTILHLKYYEYIINIFQ